MFDDLIGKKEEMSFNIVEKENNKISTYNPNNYVTFYDGKEIVGILYLYQNSFHFEGNADVSAKLFFDYLEKNDFTNIENNLKLEETRDEIRSLYAENEKMEMELVYYKHICSYLREQLKEIELNRLNSALPPIQVITYYPEIFGLQEEDLKFNHGLQEYPLFDGDINWLIVACKDWELTEKDWKERMLQDNYKDHMFGSWDIGAK